MMIVDFRPEHLLQIKPQPMQLDVYSEMHEPGYAEVLMKGPAITGIDEYGVVFCTGKVEFNGRWVLWALLSEHSGKHIVRMTRIFRRWIAGHHGMLYITVKREFPAAMRWAKMVGFKFIKPLGVLDSDIYGRNC